MPCLTTQHHSASGRTTNNQSRALTYTQPSCQLPASQPTLHPHLPGRTGVVLRSRSRYTPCCGRCTRTFGGPAGDFVRFQSKQSGVGRVGQNMTNMVGMGGGGTSRTWISYCFLASRALCGGNRTAHSTPRTAHRAQQRTAQSGDHDQIGNKQPAELGGPFARDIGSRQQAAGPRATSTCPHLRPPHVPCVAVDLPCRLCFSQPSLIYLYRLLSAPSHKKSKTPPTVRWSLFGSPLSTTTNTKHQRSRSRMDTSAKTSIQYVSYLIGVGVGELPHSGDHGGLPRPRVCPRQLKQRCNHLKDTAKARRR